MNLSKRITRALAAAMAFAAIATAVACGEETSAPVNIPEVDDGSPKPTLKLADNNFESLSVNNAIARFIIEKGYRYPVETVQQPARRLQDGLADGDVDIWLELWQQNWKEKYDAELAAGRIENLGEIYEGGQQVWIMSLDFARQNRVERVSDLKRPEVVAALAAATGTEKPLFYNCIEAWDCADMNRAKLAAYGLRGLYETVTPTAAKDIERSLIKAQTDYTPLLGYYWAPTSVMSRYEWRIIREPVYSNLCWRDLTRSTNEPDFVAPAGCAYQEIPVVKGINGGMRAKAPDVTRFLESMNIGSHPMNVMLAWAAKNNIDTQEQWQETARHYLQTFNTKWRTWVPTDVQERVDSALNEG